MTLDREVLTELCRKHGITRLRLFGSYARGDQTSESDVDLLVDFDRSIGLIEFVGIEQEFADRLGTRVDLVMERGLKPEMRSNVLADAEVIYERAA